MQNPSPNHPQKIGALARSAGVTVRTLHHYDKIGLLPPSAHTASGHRIYGKEAVARPRLIKSLRALGLSLREVRECLAHPDVNLPSAINEKLTQLRNQMEAQRCRRACLELLALACRREKKFSSKQLVATLHGLVAYKRYFTPEQLDKMRSQQELMGEEKARSLKTQWKELIVEICSHMQKGTDPSHPAVRALAEKWTALVNDFTGGDPVLAQSVRSFYEQELEIARLCRLDPRVFDFVARASKSHERRRYLPDRADAKQ
jgi:MerR family transcriptional regulator, thiopeptide resistance regulator